MIVIRNIPNTPLVVHTGQFTGRSPKDRYFVEQEKTRDKIQWGNTNKQRSFHHYQLLFKEIKKQLNKDRSYHFKGNVCADSKYNYGISLQTKIEWYVKFASNMFRQDRFTDTLGNIKILHDPHFHAQPHLHGIDAPSFIILNLEEFIILIGGTGYAGEIKKAVFSFLNYHLPEQGVLSMHCSANYDKQYGTTIFFGLSGTGKTTLSSESTKTLIGDDEHGWTSNGIFNIEGGCYAKVIGLDKEQEPEIFQATHSSQAIIENVMFDEKGNINFKDDSITKNIRSCYSLSAIKNASDTSIAPHPSTVIMLTCDAFGVLPPVSKLSIEQTIFHFISGYTAKIPGTETDVDKPMATFSACFGAPFMPRAIHDYASLLQKLLTIHQPQCWLINTGWWGGSYGVGKRMDLYLTRTILNACITHTFNDDQLKNSKYFNLSFITCLDTKKSISLDPEEQWQDKSAYQKTAKHLVELFSQNLLQLKISSTSLIKRGHIKINNQ